MNDIIDKKYIYLSEGALKTLCSKYNINFFFGATKKELITNIIPNTMKSEGYLEHFYRELAPKEQKILKFIVNYAGKNLRAVIKKKFKFEIVSMTKDSQTIYIWWLELLLYQDQMDQGFRELFFKFLGEGTLASEESVIQLIEPNHPPITKDLTNIKIHKVNGDFELLSQNLIINEPEDTVTIVRFLYRLAKDTKLKSTQKGMLTVRSRRFIEEGISAKNLHYIWVINFLLDIEYLTYYQLKLPTEAFDKAVINNDGELIKILLDKYLAINTQEEFKYMIFDAKITHGKSVSQLRKSIIETIAKLNTDKWICIDFITSKIPHTNEVVTQISNDFPCCYNFEQDYRRRQNSYNQLKDLKMVLRYFIKSFVGISAKLGLFTLATTKEESFIAEELQRSDGYYKRQYIDIEYIKLTDIGRFVLGIEKDYSSASDFSLNLSPYLYEITVENPSDRSHLFLSPIATQITEHKYQVTLKTFMNHIDTVESYCILKEEFLSKCDNIPDNWQRLFDTIERHTNSIHIVSNSAILIKVTNPKEIQQIIALDPKLQSKIIKADKLHIVVLKDDLSYVKKIFKKYGVII